MVTTTCYLLFKHSLLIFKKIIIHQKPGVHGAWERGWQSQLLSHQWHHWLYWWVCCSISEQLWYQLFIQSILPPNIHLYHSTKGAVPTCGLWQKYQISGTRAIKSQIYTWKFERWGKDCAMQLCAWCVWDRSIYSRILSQGTGGAMCRHTDMLLATEENKIKRWESCIDRYIYIFTQLCDINVA